MCTIKQKLWEKASIERREFDDRKRKDYRAAWKKRNGQNYAYQTYKRFIDAHERKVAF